MKNKIKSDQDILSADEIKAIRDLNIGYGNFVANARACGIHKNTFRYILDRGYGTTPAIEKIRKSLLVYESDQHQ